MYEMYGNVYIIKLDVNALNSELFNFLFVLILSESNSTNYYLKLLKVNLKTHRQK